MAAENLQKARQPLAIGFNRVIGVPNTQPGQPSHRFQLQEGVSSNGIIVHDPGQGFTITTARDQELGLLETFERIRPHDTRLVRLPVYEQGMPTRVVIVELIAT